MFWAIFYDNIPFLKLVLEHGFCERFVAAQFPYCPLWVVQIIYLDCSGVHVMGCCLIIFIAWNGLQNVDSVDISCLMAWIPSTHAWGVNLVRKLVFWVTFPNYCIWSGSSIRTGFMWNVCGQTASIPSVSCDWWICLASSERPQTGTRMWFLGTF